MASRDRYHLRRMVDADVDMVRDWRNSERVRLQMFTTHEISDAEHRGWWQRAKDDPTVRYYIFELDRRPVGKVSFVAIDAVNGTANWGYYLGAEDAPPGTGSAMAYFALAEAFQQVGVRKLLCEVFAGNERSLRIPMKFGFLQEGHRREHMLHNRIYEDVIELALFGRDWPAVAERMAPRVFRD